MKIEIESKVLNGKLEKNRELLSDVIKSLEGKDIVIIIEKKRKKRSNPQNSFYHGVVIPLMKQGFYNSLGEHVGTDEIHTFLKNRFLFKEIVNEQNAEIIKMPQSTTELTTIQFEEYLDKIREFSTEFLGIQIPLPNDTLTIDF
jgi:hypothetical protein